MEIVKLNGEDSQLYTLVAHLVMNKDVLASNNSYPFKTSQEYVWFVACEEGDTVGFVPVQLKSRKATINNYYVADDDPAVFTGILQELVASLRKDHAIISVTQSKHVKIFQQCGFSTMFEWEKYVKMIYAPHE